MGLWDFKPKSQKSKTRTRKLEENRYTKDERKREKKKVGSPRSMGKKEGKREEVLLVGEGVDL